MSMTEESLLLRYREVANCYGEIAFPGSFTFDQVQGLWLDKEGKPLIKCLWDSPILQNDSTGMLQNDESASLNLFNQTTITKSREGVDQSEVSFHLFGDTRITATRESADQSEAC